MHDAVVRRNDGRLPVGGTWPVAHGGCPSVATAPRSSGPDGLLRRRITRRSTMPTSALLPVPASAAASISGVLQAASCLPAQCRARTPRSMSSGPVTRSKTMSCPVALLSLCSELDASECPSIMRERNLQRFRSRPWPWRAQSRHLAQHAPSGRRLPSAGYRRRGGPSTRDLPLQQADVRRHKPAQRARLRTTHALAGEPSQRPPRLLRRGARRVLLARATRSSPGATDLPRRMVAGISKTGT